MMTLKDVAKYFDTNEFTDAYGASTFMGQLLPFSDSTRSGSSTKRRILSVAPEVIMPPRNTVISPSGQVYLVSFSSEDLFQGEAIRLKYPVVPVEDQFAIRDIGQILSSTGGVTDAYMLPSYSGRNRVEDSSELHGAYEVYHSVSESVTQGDILYGNSRYYRARESSRTDDIGFGIVTAIALESPVSTATFQAAGVLDIVEDEYSVVDPVPSVSIFTEHITFDFQHEALGYVETAPGDRAISFLKSVIPTVVVDDSIGDYRIMSVSDMGSFWTIHGRIK